MSDGIKHDDETSPNSVGYGSCRAEAQTWTENMQGVLHSFTSFTWPIYSNNICSPYVISSSQWLFLKMWPTNSFLVDNIHPGV